MEIELSELAEVKGIGKKTLQRVREYKIGKKKIKEKRDTDLIVDKLETDTIHCGDNIEVIRERIPNNSINLTVTSPPYDNLRDYEGDWDFNFKELARELYRITKKGGVVVWVVGDQTVDGSETGESFRQALYFKEIGFNLHDTMIYRKSGISFPEFNRYYPCFEYMFVFSKGKPTTTNLIQDRKNKWAGDAITGRGRQSDGSLKQRTGNKKGNTVKKLGVRFNIWEMDNGFGKGTTDEGALNHPATFPEQLPTDHIKSWSNEGDVVFDPMCGSGTTLKMAKKLGRKYIGIDVSEKYCNISRERITSN